MASSETKIKVNLFDVLAGHSVKADGFRTFTPMVEPTEIDYHDMFFGKSWEELLQTLTLDCVAEQQKNGYPHEVSLYTDKVYSKRAFAENDPTPIKVVWLLECNEVHPHNRTHCLATEDLYDYIFTYDEELLKRGPKYIENLIGTSRIQDSRSKLFKKTKNVSLIASTQNWTSGHKLRHEIARNLDPKLKVDLWGSAYRPFPLGGKVLALAEYGFSIVIENSQGPKYFTEKIIDCFRTGVIPIYWGCPNIDKYFDIDGIIGFETIEQLNHLLPKLNHEEYVKRFESVKRNFQLAKQWTSMDDRFARNLKRVLKNHE